MLLRNLGQVNESRGVGGISKGLLAKNRISNNVGAVKHFLGGLVRGLGTERHFALVEGVACANLKPARNRFFRSELSPTHASLRSQPRS